MFTAKRRQYMGRKISQTIGYICSILNVQIFYSKQLHICMYIYAHIYVHAHIQVYILRLVHIADCMYGLHANLIALVCMDY